MPVPYTFGTATAAIPLSQLDSNFATAVTIGNTAVQLGNTVTTLNNITLANVTISSGNVTLTNVSVTTANVSGTANVSSLVVLTNETVLGNTTVTGNVTASTSVVTPFVSSAAATNLLLKSAGTTAVTIDTSQNVGIGTTSPTYKLQLTSASAVDIETGVSNSAGLSRFGTRGSGNSFAGSFTAGKSLELWSAGSLNATIDSSGNVLVTGAGGLGYGTGSGGTVTQATSKSTAVTLNKPTGQITMNAAALASNTTVSFVLTNSLVAISDVVAVNIYRITGTSANYLVWADSGNGASIVNVRNISGGSLSEAIVINFAVIKGATS